MKRWGRACSWALHLGEFDDGSFEVTLTYSSDIVIQMLEGMGSPVQGNPLPQMGPLERFFRFWLIELLMNLWYCTSFMGVGNTTAWDSSGNAGMAWRMGFALYGL